MISANVHGAIYKKTKVQQALPLDISYFQGLILAEAEFTNIHLYQNNRTFALTKLHGPTHHIMRSNNIDGRNYLVLHSFQVEV